MIFISSVRATLQAGPRRKSMQKRAKNACLFRLGPASGDTFSKAALGPSKRAL